MKNYLLILLCCTGMIASAQSGITWNMTMDIANNSHDNMQPRVAVDGSGNPLVIWGRMSDESVLFSRWDGTAFTAPVKLNPTWLTVATASWMGPDIAAKGDTVYVVVKRTPEASDTNRMFIFSSFNGGVSFNPPVEFGFIADSISRLPALSIDDNGNPVVAFMKFNAAFGDSRWVVAKSSDYGNTFSVDVKASGYNGLNDEVCDCCPGTVISTGNTCAMLYRDNASNIRDMWVGISSNNAASFPTGFEVDTADWMIMSCPSSGPDGVIIGDTLFSVFMSAGVVGSYRVYISKTSVSTGALYSFSPITGTIAGLTQQNYPRIARYGNAVGIVWKQNVSGTAQLPMFFTNNIADGFSSVYDTVDLQNITNTDIAVSNGKVCVVWQDDNAGTVKYRTGTFTPAIVSSVNEITENNLAVYPNPTTGALYITNKNTEKLAVTIYNSIGEKIYSGIHYANGQISTAGYPSGIYFAQIVTATNSFTQQFIKQ